MTALKDIEQPGIKTVLPVLISCDHCGVVIPDTPRFGWKRWRERVVAGSDAPVNVVDVEIYRHHCPAAVQFNEWVAGGLVHMVAPEEAVAYEDWEEHNA